MEAFFLKQALCLTTKKIVPRLPRPQARDDTKKLLGVLTSPSGVKN
jgi:hypothetical protein